jgi:hypothetical protein
MNAQTDTYRALQINPNIYGKAFPVKRKMKGTKQNFTSASPEYKILAYFMLSYGTGMSRLSAGGVILYTPPPIDGTFLSRRFLDEKFML